MIEVASFIVDIIFLFIALNVLQIMRRIASEQTRIRVLLTRKFRFECEDCGHRFTNQRALDIHEVNEHGGEGIR